MILPHGDRKKGKGKKERSKVLRFLSIAYSTIRFCPEQAHRAKLPAEAKSRLLLHKTYDSTGVAVRHNDGD